MGRGYDFDLRVNDTPAREDQGKIKFVYLIATEMYSLKRDCV